MQTENLSSLISYYYFDFYHHYGDPRVANLFLMSTPWPLVTICISYLAFVKLIGPWLMKHRDPLELFWFLRIYNSMMIVINLISFLAACYLLNFGLDTFGCRIVDTTKRDLKSMLTIYYGYMFLFTRLLEFVDTFCFILRKKYRQVSAFHVFHHFSVPIAVWYFLKFAAGGHVGLFPLLNSLVHTFMYSYYFLATFDWAKPYLKWKKHLTQMQIVQFIILIAHSSQSLFLNDCKFPKVFLYVIIGFSVIFIYLFISFYLETYGKSTVKMAKNMGRRLSQQMHHSGVNRLSSKGAPNSSQEHLARSSDGDNVQYCSNININTNKHKPD